MAGLDAQRHLLSLRLLRGQLGQIQQHWLCYITGAVCSTGNWSCRSGRAWTEGVEELVLPGDL